MLRLAGQALKNGGKFLIRNMGNNAGEVALRVVPDHGIWCTRCSTDTW